MDLPIFFKENIDAANEIVILDEETSKHIVQVLRMKTGEPLQITDGRGQLITAEILKGHKKNCEVTIADSQFNARASRKISIAVSLIKNTSRFEWLLEKITEIGVHEIIPLICDRTEKQRFRYDRMKNICTSAMLQSRQVWMPELLGPTTFKSIFPTLSFQQRFIAHCAKADKKTLTEIATNISESSIILIGPEGDFTPAEIELAVAHQFIPVSLGETRLRTETAGIVAAALLAIR